MRAHAKSRHQINLDEAQAVRPAPANQPPITTLFSTVRKDTIEALCARLCAKDGISFRTIASSADIKRWIERDSVGIPPNYHGTVRNYVMKFAEQVKNSYKVAIQNAKALSGSLSIGFDEWTSIRNRRYTNLLIYSSDSFWNLGLVRIHGSTNHLLLKEDIQSRLEDFDINMDDIIAMMSDGAAINGAISNATGLLQQKCLAHGIQLAVNDILYNSDEESNNCDGNDDAFEDEIEDDDLGILAFGTDIVSSIDTGFKSNAIQQLIDKVRDVVKMFRRSPVRNDELQHYVKIEHNKELKLILDCKTRWSSLAAMLERFYLLRNCLRYYLSTISSEYSFSQEEFALIKSITEALSSVAKCVKAICRTDCSSYEAHLAIEVVLDELAAQKTELSTDLASRIVNRVQDRISDFYYLQVYLEDKKLALKPKYFKMLNRQQCKGTAVFILRHFEKSPAQPDDDALPVQPIDSQGSASSMDEFYQKMEAKKRKEPVPTVASKEKALEAELSVYDKIGTKGPLLQKILLVTRTVRPTTVECERAFSIAGAFCNKIRSRMSDETLNCLCFLKAYYNNHYNSNK